MGEVTEEDGRTRLTSKSRSKIISRDKRGKGTFNKETQGQRKKAAPKMLFLRVR